MIHSYFVEGREAYKTNPDAESKYPVESEAHRSWIAGFNHEWWLDREEDS